MNFKSFSSNYSNACYNLGQFMKLVNDVKMYRNRKLNIF